MTIVLEFILILLLLVANGVFAMSEIAVVSSRKVRLEQMANRGDGRARAALKLARDPSRFLSTVQVGITLIGIFAGAFGGATLAATIAGWLAAIPLLRPYSTAIGLGIVVLVITYLSLIIGELVPKRLALNNPERMALILAGPMRVLARLAAPVVSLLTASTDAILRLMRVRPPSGPAVTEEEIKILLEQGTQSGVILEAEQDIVESVFRLADRRVGALMTPRNEVVWLDQDDSLDVNRQKIINSHHSCFPVAQGQLDNLVGIAQTKDLLAECFQGQAPNLSAGLHPPLFVLESLSALQLLEVLKKSRTHVAFVVDEFGVIQGLVTLNDIVEVIFGDVPLLHEVSRERAVQREDGSWLLDGMLPADEVKEIFEIRHLPDEARGLYQTLGGFVMNQLGHIPQEGEQFEWSDLKFEIMDMDGHRVDKVLVTPLPPPAAKADGR